MSISAEYQDLCKAAWGDNVVISSEKIEVNLDGSYPDYALFTNDQEAKDILIDVYEHYGMTTYLSADHPDKREQLYASAMKTAINNPKWIRDAFIRGYESTNQVMQENWETYKKGATKDDSNKYAYISLAIIPLIPFSYISYAAIEPNLAIISRLLFMLWVVFVPMFIYYFKVEIPVYCASHYGNRENPFLSKHGGQLEDGVLPKKHTISDFSSRFELAINAAIDKVTQLIAKTRSEHDY